MSEQVKNLKAMCQNPQITDETLLSYIKTNKLPFNDAAITLTKHSRSKAMKELSMSQNAYKVDFYQNTLLKIACRNNNLELVRYFVERFDCDPTLNNYSAFKTACYCGSEKVVDYIIHNFKIVINYFGDSSFKDSIIGKICHLNSQNMLFNIIENCAIGELDDILIYDLKNHGRKHFCQLFIDKFGLSLSKIPHTRRERNFVKWLQQNTTSKICDLAIKQWLLQDI